MTQGEYQYFLRRGYRIIRKDPARLSIQLKKFGSTGWIRLHKASSADEMNKKFDELLLDTKTLADR